jgi:predicted small secreted protein
VRPLQSNLKGGAMIRLFTLVLTLMTLVVLTGCNTIAGAGRDIERAGQEIEDAAD